LRKILFATANEGKLLEAEKLLSHLDFEVEQLEVLYPEIQASTLEDVASFGMEWILKEKKVDDAIILEDAGLFIHALDGFPGVFSAYIFKSIGLDGILKLMDAKGDRSAHFESCIAYYEKGLKIMLFKGRVDGTIALQPKGSYGFGYDPIFIPEGENRAFAEMPTEEKNRISHRGGALSSLVEFLSKR
jgi:XTP/dITP diphosphohydrolase